MRSAEAEAGALGRRDNKMLWRQGAIGTGPVILATCLITALLWPQASLGAQQPESITGAQDDTRCGDAMQWAQTHTAVARLFGATSTGEGYEPRHSTWREYPSQQALKEAAEGANLFYVASLWALPSGGTFVQTEQSSLSGDWGLHVDYCFDPSGLVAKITSELRMLPSRAVTRQTIDYDARGREVEHVTTRRDLDTEAALGTDGAQEAQAHEIFPTPVYRRVSEIPFYEMLRTRK